jgi:hypothetical protein
MSITNSLVFALTGESHEHHPRLLSANASHRDIVHAPVVVSKPIARHVFSGSKMPFEQPGSKNETASRNARGVFSSTTDTIVAASRDR